MWKIQQSMVVMTSDQQKALVDNESKSQLSHPNAGGSEDEGEWTTHADMSAIYYTKEREQKSRSRSPNRRVMKIAISTAYLVSELDVVVVDPTSRNHGSVSSSDPRVGEQSSHHAT
jgi:hypothetical protein